MRRRKERRRKPHASLQRVLARSPAAELLVRGADGAAALEVAIGRRDAGEVVPALLRVCPDAARQELSARAGVHGRLPFHLAFYGGADRLVSAAVLRCDFSKRRVGLSLCHAVQVKRTE